MSFGKLYGFKDNARTAGALVVAGLNKLDVELVETQVGPHATGQPKEFLDTFPLKKVPAFIGSNGLVLSECISIYFYFAAQNEKTGLLGHSKADKATIFKWFSFVNSEVLSAAGTAVGQATGRSPPNKKTFDIAIKDTLKLLEIIEKHLQNNTYLVGERVTIADIFSVSVLRRIFSTVITKENLSAFPNIVRWYKLVSNLPGYVKLNGGEFKFIDAPIQPPKKEKPQAQKKESKKEKKQKDGDDDEEVEKPAPKPKHPLEALGKPEMPIDQWKRVYSNEDTRAAALPWFWEHFNPKEYSLYKVKYKYDDELTLTFMSNNLIGGFFNRLSESTKYLFGCMVVFGENNNNGIIGVFLVRGQEYLPAFDVAPDWESYDFTKLDPSKPEDKALVEDLWAWDKPVIINGKSREIADGKVFK